MKLGRRRGDAEPVAEPTDVTAPPPPGQPPARPPVAGGEPPAAETEAIVDADAVELPAAEAPVAHTPPAAAHMPPATPFPVAEEPVAVVSSGPDPGGVTPLSEAGPVHASGHSHGTAPSWPEPVLALATERPEIVVGAAFVGGILLAAILRRLGN